MRHEAPRRWYEFTIMLAIKRNYGSFGIKREYCGVFTFCARSRAEAVMLAGGNAKGQGERIVHVVSILPTDHEVKEAAQVFPIESPGLKSIREIASEIKESEAA